MRVQLAYPFDGHAPDDTVEVDDSVGRQLLKDGRARRPDSLGAATIDEIKAAVGNDPGLAAIAISEEQGRARPRKTLLDHLGTIANPAGAASTNHDITRS